MCIRLKRRWSRLLTKVLGSWAWFLHWSSEKSDKSELPESNILATSDLRTFLKGTELFFCTSKSYRMIPRRVWGLPSRDTAHVTVEPFSEWHAICFGGVDRSLFYFCAAGMVHMGICSLLFQICSWHLKQIFCSKKVFSSFQDSSGHSRATDLDAQQQVPEARTCLANAALRETQLLKGCIVVDGPGWSNLSVATIYHAIGHA